MPHDLSPSQEVFSWLFSLQLTAVGAWQTGQQSFWFSVQRLSLHWMAWQYGVENLQRQFYEHVHSFSVWQMSFSLSLDLGDWVLLDWASSSVHIKALYRKPRGQKFRNGPALFLPICNLAQFLCTLISAENKPGQDPQLWSSPILYMVLEFKQDELYSIPLCITIEMVSVLTGMKAVLVFLKAFVFLKYCLVPWHLFSVHLGT